MNNSSDHDDQQVPATDTGKEFAARRTVVKGLASAVPVVMTLGCGKALAQTSSVECLANPPTAQPQVCIDPREGSNDRFLRRNKTVLVDIDTQTGMEVTPDSPLSFSTSSPASRDVTPTATRSRSRTSNVAAAQDSRVEQIEVRKQCLVYVNERGQFVRDAANGNPTTESCYASFMAT